MASYKPGQIAEKTVETGVAKANNPWTVAVVLGFLAGAFIALGFCWIYVLLQVRLKNGEALPPLLELRCSLLVWY